MDQISEFRSKFKTRRRVSDAILWLAVLQIPIIAVFTKSGEKPFVAHVALVVFVLLGIALCVWTARYLSCPKCGHWISELRNPKFCTGCGFGLVEELPASAQGGDPAQIDRYQVRLKRGTRSLLVLLLSSLAIFLASLYVEGAPQALVFGSFVVFILVAIAITIFLGWGMRCYRCHSRVVYGRTSNPKHCQSCGVRLR